MSATIIEQLDIFRTKILSYNTKENNLLVSVFLERVIEFIDFYLLPRRHGYFSQGDIVFAHLGINVGGEINKKRPCVVYSTDKANRGDCIVIIPLKTYNNKIPHSFCHIIEPNITNKLRKVSYCSITDLRSISKSRVSEIRGKLDTKTLYALHKKTQKMFGIKEKDIITMPLSSEP